MIRENIHAGVLKAKKSKKRKKKKGGGGAEAEQSSGATEEAWKDMARKHGWVEKGGGNSQQSQTAADAGKGGTQARRGDGGGARTQRGQAQSNGEGGGTRELVSAVVVYTPVPGDEVLDAVGRKDRAVRNLIQGARQKPGHVVLMARRADSEKLKECVRAFELWGFQAKTYALRTRLQGTAAEGAQSKVSNAGLCWKYMKGAACPYGAKCKFTCYPNVQQRG